MKPPAVSELNIVVDLLSERSIGNEVVFLAETEQYSNAGIVEATLNIQALGDGAVELLSKLKLYLEMPDMINLYDSANVAINSVEQVQDITTLLDGRTWQERASVDLTVSYCRELLNQGAEWFNKLEINGTTNNGKDNNEHPADGDTIVKVEIMGELEN
nr:MAG TPA: hypothetical protein [Caudoviricetes sp.]DAY82706.1 MAG TPA: hypothetical protein [Caudoviricetes sp.]